MKDRLIDFFKNKKIIILGFGREGKSSYDFIRKNLKDKEIFIADQKQLELNDENTTLICGDNYLNDLETYDIIIKSPGISFKDIDKESLSGKIYSQLELFLMFTDAKTIGITGTKGKSTTSSLIYKALKDQGRDALLLGNIGVPLFDFIDSINDNTILVIEMSSHQLEFINKSPNISIITNLYQEHLDHYNSYDEYINAKLNICKYQTSNDYFIYNSDDELLESKICNVNSNKIKVTKKDGIPLLINNSNMKGDSSIYNIRFTIEVAKLFNLDLNKVYESINSFKTLPHRMEYVGKYNDIIFYDDAIATIPEACINSIEALKTVDTLIFGGLNRGVDLTYFTDYLNNGKVRNLICMPSTGHTIGNKITNKDIFIYIVNDMEEAVTRAYEVTRKDMICLLAPAAASYEYYKNFEEKGNHYQELVKKNK